MSIFLGTLMIKRKPSLVMYTLQEFAQRMARWSSRNIGPMHKETLLLAQPRVWFLQGGTWDFTKIVEEVATP